MFSIRSSVLSVFASFVSSFVSVRLARLLTVCGLLFTATTPALTQVPPPEVEWERSFEVSGDNFGQSVKQSSDGGYVIVGISWPLGFNIGLPDISMIRTDHFGNLLWAKSFGDEKEYEVGLWVEETREGDYIVAGTYEGSALIIKITLLGDLVWRKELVGNSSQFNFVQQTADGGYILAGSTFFQTAGFSDVYLVKVDSSVDLVWERKFGGVGYDLGSSVKGTGDGGYVVVGETESTVFRTRDVYLIKTDSDGNLLWEKTYGGEKHDYGYSVDTRDDGYVVAGQTQSFGAGGSDTYLISIDHEGKLLWQATFGGGRV